MSENISNLERYTRAKIIKVKELEYVRLLEAVVGIDKEGALAKLISSRLGLAEIALTGLDTEDPALTAEGFRRRYAAAKEVRDEYRLLLDLLRDPEKRAAKVMEEISKLEDEIRLMEKAAKSAQY